MREHGGHRLRHFDYSQGLAGSDARWLLEHGLLRVSRYSFTLTTLVITISGEIVIWPARTRRRHTTAHSRRLAKLYGYRTNPQSTPHGRYWLNIDDKEHYS